MANSDAPHDDHDSARPIRVREAAARLNLSPVQIRRLIHAGWLRAVKDNRGHWLVHLPTEGDVARQLSDGAREEVDAILTKILMDDLSYLEDRSDDQENQIARLAELATRQADLLSRAVESAEQASAERDSARRKNQQLAATAARATALLEDAVSRAELGATRAAALEAAVRRASALMERAVSQAKSADGRAKRLQNIVERSLALLERRVGADTSGRPALAKLERMMARALGAAEDAEQARGQADERLKTRERQLDRLADMLERSLDTGTRAANAVPASRRRWPFSVFSRR